MGCGRQSSWGCARSIVEMQTLLRCVLGVVCDPHAPYQGRSYTYTPLLLFLLLLSDSKQKPSTERGFYSIALLFVLLFLLLLL